MTPSPIPIPIDAREVEEMGVFDSEERVFMPEFDCDSAGPPAGHIGGYLSVWTSERAILLNLVPNSSPGRIRSFPLSWVMDRVRRNGRPGCEIIDEAYTVVRVIPVWLLEEL